MYTNEAAQKPWFKDDKQRIMDLQAAVIDLWNLSVGLMARTKFADPTMDEVGGFVAKDVPAFLDFTRWELCGNIPRWEMENGASPGLGTTKSFVGE